MHRILSTNGGPPSVRNGNIEYRHHCAIPPYLVVFLRDKCSWRPVDRRSHINTGQNTFALQHGLSASCWTSGRLRFTCRIIFAKRRPELSEEASHQPYRIPCGPDNLARKHLFLDGIGYQVASHSLGSEVCGSLDYE